MGAVQRGIVVVLDGKGDLASWLGSDPMAVLGSELLPARKLYLGPQSGLSNVDAVLQFSSEMPFSRDALENAFRYQVNGLKDAQVAFELAQQGTNVVPSTTVMLVGRTGDPLMVEYFTDVLKFLHRVADKSFPQQLFQWSAILMLPNLFGDPSVDDFGRTYALLKQIDGYQLDPPAFKSVAGVPVRLLDTIWLANSSNERGNAVGGFPEAGAALTTFLQAVFKGSVSCATPSVHRLLDGKRPNYSSFGCTILCLDREYMQQWLTHRLDSAMLPNFLAPARVSLEVALAEAKKCISQSALNNASQALASDGNTGSLFTPVQVRVTPENTLSTESFFREVQQKRDAFAADAAHDIQIKLQQQRTRIEKEGVEDLNYAGAVFADEHGLRAAELFLNILVNDPPDDINAPTATASFTLFNLLGASIDRVDDIVGYRIGAKQIEEQRAKLTKAEGVVVECRSKRDILHEEVRSLEARREEILKLEEEERVAQLLVLAQKSDELVSAERAVRESEYAARAARATLRGLIIARRNYRKEDRHAAYGRRAAELEEAICAARQIHQKEVAEYRQKDAERLKLYEERSAWVQKIFFFYPVAAAITALLLQALPILTVGLNATLAWYGNNLGAVLRVVAGGLLVYAAWASWIYWQRFAIPIRDMEREIKVRLEQVMRAANEIVRTTNVRLRFDFDWNVLHAAVTLLYTVRELGRATLTQVQELIRSLELRASSPPPPPPPNNLYRSSMWTTEHLERVFTTIVPDTAEQWRALKGELGGPSKWLFLTPGQAQERLTGYGTSVFQSLESLTLEDFVFHPRYSQAAAQSRLAALFEAATPYLRLKSDLLDGNSATRDVAFVYNGRNSRCAEELRTRGIAPDWEHQAEKDSLSVIRTRVGFPAYFLAEIDTYWNDYLRNPTVARPDAGEENFPELIPPRFRRNFDTVAEIFLLLWCAGDVQYAGGKYTFSGTVLGDRRMSVYDRLMNDPRMDRTLELMRSRLNTIRSTLLSDNCRVAAFLGGQQLEFIEREITDKYSVMRAAL